MARGRLILAPALGAVILAGCSTFAPADARLCSAAQNVTAAMALTATAIAADERGDLAQAQGLATQARTLTELAHGTLQQVPQSEHPKVPWQGLLEASADTATAANSLLPAYANTHGVGPEQLAGAQRAMDNVRAELPSMCFDIPNDVETPGAS